MRFAVLPSVQNNKYFAIHMHASFAHCGSVMSMAGKKQRKAAPERKQMWFYCHQLLDLVLTLKAFKQNKF